MDPCCTLAADPIMMGQRPFLIPAVPEKVVKMEVRIYVGNLPKSATQEELKSLFMKAGEVTSVEVVKDRNSGEPKGFAFISMTSQADADKAISMYNDHAMGENKLKVNVAKPRVERA